MLRYELFSRRFLLSAQCTSWRSVGENTVPCYGPIRTNVYSDIAVQYNRLND